MPKGLETFFCGSNSISKIENLPKDLKSFNCGRNSISKIEGLPEGLQTFWCGSNSISKIEGLPEDLKSFNCDYNCISKIEKLPIGLKTFHCNNRISVIENLPLGLVNFQFNIQNVKFVDNVSVENISFSLKGYSAIKRIQLRMKRRYRLKVAAAKIIHKGLYNWLWKPEGIVMRIEKRNLRETLGMFQ